MEKLEKNYLEKMGRLLINTFNITGHTDYDVGRMSQNVYHFFIGERERDMREQVNQSQWDEKRIDIIGSNGATGEHYE